VFEYSDVRVFGCSVGCLFGRVFVRSGVCSGIRVFGFLKNTGFGFGFGFGFS
jgi:hypothetical protein